ncbi:hypothetical protein Hdeb2414_s0009g00327801 [Helianthus debilis subsp. tardiflorus]
MEVTNDSIIDWIIGSVTDVDADADATTSTAPRIPKVPGTVREKHDYETYYVPKVVSIGPYHFGEPKLQLIEKRKPVIAMKLFSNNKEAIISLYETLSEPELVKELRSFYEENSTTEYPDKVFTKMMLLDGCFILYFIDFLYRGGAEDYSELKSNEIFFVRRDLYLLENQIPFKVLMKLTGDGLLDYVKPFIGFSSFVIRSSNEESGNEDDREPNHLLDALHGKHSMIVKAPTLTFDPIKFSGCNFRNVSELADVGIHFKPIKDTLSMTHIEFVKGWWRFSAVVKLPRIAVSDYTRPMLLNLMAYETCRCSINDSWDVKVLRKAWVLDNYLASDKEVVELFDEIGTDLVPSSFAYIEAKYKMQRHYDSWSNTLFSQLKNEYFKSPWAIFALLGALIALFLTGVQTYYTIWSPESKCDDLCQFLKMNHHL